MTIAQILMVITLLLMISGKTPLYMTAIIGSAIAAVVAGFPLTGGKDVVTITSFVVSGLNPVMLGQQDLIPVLPVHQQVGILLIQILSIHLTAHWAFNRKKAQVVPLPAETPDP